MSNPAESVVRFFVLLLFVALAPVASAQDQPAAASPADTILILDASGSMWGQIDGVNKIVIARDVVEALILNLPAGQRLGLVAYGHRREGDCDDIQTLADVGADREALVKAVRQLSPKGKTPLSRSVQHAAEKLDYTKKAATVVLVSDGLENCDIDPCALARTLEENGLDFTVHVVGFDVTAQERAGLQCIAAETGGEFLAADNAAELTAALKTVAVAPAPEPANPAPSQVVLKATILADGPQILSKLAWTVTPEGEDSPVFQQADAGIVKTAIAPGDYRVEAVWTGWPDGSEKRGTMDITIEPQNIHVVTIPIDLALPVTLEAPAETGEGQSVEVTWSGPDNLGATVGVNRPDDAPGAHIFFFATAKARAAHARQTGNETGNEGDETATSGLGIPPEAGDYEIRYTLDRPRVVLARSPLKVIDNPYSLAAPAKAPVATVIEIGWTGVLTPGDLVTMVPAGDTRVFDNARYITLKESVTTSLITPKEPGQYEIRYVMYGGYTTYPGMQHSVQTSVPITVTDVSATVSGPATAVGGSTIEVQWTGPAEGWQDDYLSVVAPGAQKFSRDSWARVAVRGEAVNPTPIRVPAVEGEYELVYSIAPGDRIIARSAIVVTRARASVEAPDRVPAGQDFPVSYSGDGFAGDRVVVVAADAADEKMWGVSANYGFAAKADGDSGTIPGRVITKPGAYEVRYVTGLQHQVLARDLVTVTE